MAIYLIVLVAWAAASLCFLFYGRKKSEKNDAKDAGIYRSGVGGDIRWSVEIPDTKRFFISFPDYCYWAKEWTTELHERYPIFNKYKNPKKYSFTICHVTKKIKVVSVQ